MVTPTELKRYEKLQRRWMLPTLSEFFRQALNAEWERSEAERLAKKEEGK